MTKKNVRYNYAEQRLIYIIHAHGSIQDRPLADWTDCFQSGPAPKGAPRFACY